MDALVGAVDLVDDDDHAVAQLERAAEHEAGLGHGALGGVDEEDDAVDHLQDTLDLAAEVGVAGGVDDVDLRVAVLDGGVLGEDGDAALTLEVVRVHDALDRLLILAVDAALLEHLVDERRLAVVDVGDDGYVSQFLILQRKNPFLWANEFTNLNSICLRSSNCKGFPHLWRQKDTLCAKWPKGSQICSIGSVENPFIFGVLTKNRAKTCSCQVIKSII